MAELFEEIGLTGNEGKVYDILIKFGKLSASEISSKSGVPYGRIYDVLNSLIEKGLVIIVPEKTKKYIPSSPDAFLEIIKKKQEILEKAKEMAKELKQFYEKKEKNPVVIGEGEKAFWKIIKEMDDAEKYNYSIKWTAVYKPENALSQKKLLKKGVDIKVLVRDDDETKKDVKSWLKINKNMRSLINEGFACDIRDDKEVMLGLIKNNTTILIRDKAFAKIMKKLFLAYYDKAEKIK